MLLEVIAGSVPDAREAERGGAGRLELVRELERGGLTPSLDFVREARDAVSIPIRVMIRETDGYGAGGIARVEALARVTSQVAALGVDGVVIGFLKAGRLDMTAMDAVLAVGAALPATFHHAFDALPDPIAVVPELARWPQIDRILTSGGAGNWNAKRAVLERLVAAASPRITILAGGGIDIAALRALSKSSVTEAHVGRAARVPPTVEGVVSARRVAELVEVARR
jgi:copper homeostasis protein